MAALAARDYERLLDLAVTILRTPAASTPWPVLLREVVTALHGTIGVLTDVRSRPDREVQAWIPALAGPPDALGEDILHGHPLLRHYAATADDTPKTMSDLVDDRSWRGTRAYLDSCAAFGGFRQVAVPVPDSPTVRLALAVGRPDMDFTDRELAYVRRLQPLLSGVAAQHRELGRWRENSATDPVERAAEHNLTPRELTILGLLADGLTAEAIARRLRISPRTVHRHLEHVYRKLAVSDRLAAVLRAKAVGLLR